MRLLALLILIGLSFPSSAQILLNGSFENNSAGADQINLTNPDFNSYMEDCIGFGSFGNIDIITSTTWGGGGAQEGDWYISLTGGGTDIVSMELDTELQAGTTYTLSYYDRADPGYIAFPVEVGISNDPESFGTSIYTAPDVPTDNVWTERVFSFEAPFDALYITVQQSDGATGNWLHIDNFSFPCNVSLDLGENLALCEGESVTLDAENPGATYEWQDGSTESTLEVDEPGIYNVIVTLDGCSGSDEIEVTYQELPTVDLGADISFCAGESEIIVPTTEYVDDYLWSDNSINSTFEATTSGIITLEVSNSCGTASDEIEVDEISLPVFDLGEDQDICEDEILVLDATLAGATYEWQDGSTESTINVDTPGNYEVEVTLNGCSSTDDIDILIGMLPTVDLGLDIEICENQSELILPVSTNVDDFLWHDGSDLSEYEAMNEGLMWVVVSNDCGIDSDSIYVEQFDLPYVDLGPDLNRCEGEIVVLEPEGSDIVSYLWQDGSTSELFEVSESGTFDLVVSNSCGSFEDEVYVHFTELPRADLGDDMLVCDDQNVTLNPGTNNSSFQYLWQDDSNERFLNVYESGEYSVVVSNECGIAEDQITVEFEDCSCDIYVPNAITPNGDGINEVFRPVFECEVTEYTIVIVDRWGKVVFTSSDLQEYWLGGVEEAYVEDGLYNYFIEYRDRGPEIKKEYGHISIIR